MYQVVGGRKQEYKTSGVRSALKNNRKPPPRTKNHAVGITRCRKRLKQRRSKEKFDRTGNEECIERLKTANEEPREL